MANYMYKAKRKMETVQTMYNVNYVYSANTAPLSFLMTKTMQ